MTKEPTKEQVRAALRGGTPRDRTNDLYCRNMPSAKAIEEIKHLAAVKDTTVGEIVYREHRLASYIRDLIREFAAGRQSDLTAADLMAAVERFKLTPESI